MQPISHTSRMAKAIEAYDLSNKRPAVDEPANDFEVAVNEWAALQDFLTELKDLMKPLLAEERRARDEIAFALKEFYSDNLKEGMNNYELSNHRKLKFGLRIDRKIEPGELAIAREAFEKATGGHNDQTFDDCIRVKYELAATPWKKLTGAAKKAFSRCIITKHAAPTLAVD